MQAKKINQRGMTSAGMMALAGLLAGPGTAALGVGDGVGSAGAVLLAAHGVVSGAAAQPTTGSIWTGTIGQGLNQSLIAVMVDGPSAGKISVQRLNVTDAVLRDANFERDRMRFRLIRPARGIEWVFDLRINPDGVTARGTLKEGANQPTTIELRRWDGKGPAPTVTPKPEEPMSVPPAMPPAAVPAATAPSATPTAVPVPAPAATVPGEAATPGSTGTPAAPTLPAQIPAPVSTTNPIPPAAVPAPAATPSAASTPSTPSTAPAAPGAVAPGGNAGGGNAGGGNAGGGNAGGTRRLNPVLNAPGNSGGNRPGGRPGGSQVTAPLPPAASLPAGQPTPEVRASGGLVPLTPATSGLSRPGTNVPQAASEPGPATAPPLDLIPPAVVTPAEKPVEPTVVPATTPVPVPQPAPVATQTPTQVPAPAPVPVPSEPAAVPGVKTPEPAVMPTSPEGVSGEPAVWEGRVVFSPSRTARITVSVDALNRVQVSIPEMAMFDLPAGTLTAKEPAQPGSSQHVLDGADLRFEIPGLPASAAARLKLAISASNHGRYDGTLTHLGAEFAVRLAPTAAVSNRAQTPRPPLPYLTRQMLVTATDGAKLPGTLTLPNSEVFGPGPHPAVVLLSGSGVQDRDQTIFGHKTLAVLADALARAGIASLRCDDRGYLGHYNPAGNQVTSLTLAADALVIHAALRGEIGIDSTRVGIMGHSEGGLLAAMAASQSPDVAFVGMLAAPTQIGRDVIARQITTVRLAGQPLDEGTKASLTQAFANVVASMDQDASLRQAVEELVRLQVKVSNIPISEGTAEWNALIDKGAREFQSPWLRTYVRLDPAEYLTKVRVPTLAVFGMLDSQVDGEANAKRLRGVFGGIVPLKIEELSGHNHLLQTATTGEVAEYEKIEETMSPRAITAIVRWAVMVTGARPVAGDRAGDGRVSSQR